jgi:hypothetical protein
VPASSELFTPGGISAPPRGPISNEPAWLDAGPRISAGKPGVGQMPLFPESGTLPTATKVFTGLSLLGMLYGVNHWARPTLKASKIEQKDGVWGWLQRVIDSIQAFLDHGTNYVSHEVSKGAAHAAHGPAYTIGLSADRWNQLVWNVTYMQLENEQVTRRLVHTVIPRQINRQTRPLRARTRRLEKGQTRQIRKTNALRRWTHTEIVRHIKPQIHHLERVTTKTLPQRIHREELKRGKLETKVRRDHKILMKLLPLLTVAGAVGLVLRAFGRLGLNFLRCQNVKDFGNEICPSPPGSGRGLARFAGRFGSLLGDLAALSFAPFLLTEACQLVHVIEALAIKVQPEIDALVLGIEGFVCGGTADLPSAIEASDLKRATPLPTGL